MSFLLNAGQQALLKLEPEVAHDTAIKSLRLYGQICDRLGKLPSIPSAPVELFGKQFANPVGLAAGLDKNARAISGFFQLGFGFVEVGTVTPRPQPGNPKPRIFRLPSKQAVINRMGFNNAGVAALVEQVRQAPRHGLLGINLGKNKDTPEENAADDYVAGLKQVYTHADYVTINISSPNTPGLRDLQFGETLANLLSAIKSAQTALADELSAYVPILVKIAPDIDDENLLMTVEQIREAGLDGIIATNTTVDKSAVAGLPHGDEVGGLSGLPVQAQSNKVLQAVRAAVGDDYPIIGVGGIMCGADAAAKIAAGADLVQLYTGFIYRGPKLVSECVAAIKKAQAN